MSTSDKDTYWNAFKNTVWKLDQSTPELSDIASYLHLGEGALVGLATYAAMKRGNVAPRVWAKLAPKSIRPATAPSRAASALGTIATFGANAGAGLAAAAMTSKYLTTTTDIQNLARRLAYAPLMPGYSPCAHFMGPDDADILADMANEFYDKHQSSDTSSSFSTTIADTEVTVIRKGMDDPKISVTINGVDVPPNKVSEMLARIENDEPLEEEDHELFLYFMFKKYFKNCRLLHKLEHQIRTDKGIAPHEPVEIPFMGVPTDDELPESVLATKAKCLQFANDGYKCRSYNQEETNLVYEWNRNYFFPSVAAGMVTFICLRRVPQRLMIRIQPYLNTLLKQEYVLISPKLTKPNIVVRAGKFGFDVFVSTAVMYSFCFWDAFQGRLPRFLVETPLVSGRSTISEHVCEDLIKEYGNMLSTFSESEHQSLRHLCAMVHNCQRRQEEERQLRLKQGLPDDVPVKIPPPGVSGGITRDEMDKFAEWLVEDCE